MAALIRPFASYAVAGSTIFSPAVFKKGFGVQRMKRSRAHSRTTWTTKYSRNVRPPTVTAFRGVVSEQIEAGGNEVYKLKFGNSPHSHKPRTAGGAHNRGFGNRCIDHAPLAKLINEPVCNLKRAP